MVCPCGPIRSHCKSSVQPQARHLHSSIYIQPCLGHDPTAGLDSTSIGTAEIWSSRGDQSAYIPERVMRCWFYGLPLFGMDVPSRGKDLLGILHMSAHLFQLRAMALPAMRKSLRFQGAAPFETATGCLANHLYHQHHRLTNRSTLVTEKYRNLGQSWLMETVTHAGAFLKASRLAYQWRMDKHTPSCAVCGSAQPNILEHLHRVVPGTPTY